MKILITGPESSGKSTLSRQLAWALDGVFVAEQARAYLQQLDRPYTAADLPKIWQQQRLAEERAASSGASFLICDTGPEVIRVWSEVKYGYCAPEVLRAATERTYDLTLLCRSDLPWSYDPLREHPAAADRDNIYEMYRHYLSHAIPIGGTDRAGQAIRAVQTLLAADWPPPGSLSRPAKAAQVYRQ